MSATRVCGCGFSLIELVVSMALSMTLAAGVFVVVSPSRHAFDTQFEVMDMSQHLRVAADTLATDIANAGTGAVSGGERGPLIYAVAPILPMRQKTIGGDAPGSFRTDAITLWRVPPASAEATLSAAIGPGQLTLKVTPASGCSPANILCGWTTGTTLLVLGGFGRYDMFTLISIAGTSGQLRAEVPGGVLLNTHPVGSTVVPLVQRGYFLKLDTVRNVWQLAAQDGPRGSDVPVVDHVVSLKFEYAGDPRPSVLTKPLTGPVPPWTRYGPKPPNAGQSATGYPDGENCLFRVDPASAAKIPRLPDLGADALVPLGDAELGDGGPWCPDAASPSRFDADLLRIRTVTAIVRVESALDALRGPAGVLFVHAGTSRDSSRWLADREIRFTVAPRNLNVTP